MTVYVMGCEGSRLVKIGHTSNPAKRLGEIRRMSPDPVRLLWESGPEHGAGTERKLHELFRLYRKHGEWFDFGQADPVALVSAAAELPDVVFTASHSPRSSEVTGSPVDAAKYAKRMAIREMMMLPPGMGVGEEHGPLDVDGLLTRVIK